VYAQSQRKRCETYPSSVTCKTTIAGLVDRFFQTAVLMDCMSFKSLYIKVIYLV